MLRSRLDEIGLLLEAHLMCRGPSRKFLRAAAKRLQACLLDGPPCPSKLTPVALATREILARAHFWIANALDHDDPAPSVRRAMDLLGQVPRGAPDGPKRRLRSLPAG